MFHLSIPDQVITALVFAEGGGWNLCWLKHGKWTHLPVSFQLRLIYHETTCRGSNQFHLMFRQCEDRTKGQKAPLRAYQQLPFSKLQVGLHESFCGNAACVFVSYLVLR